LCSLRFSSPHVLKNRRPRLQVAVPKRRIMPRQSQRPSQKDLSAPWKSRQPMGNSRSHRHHSIAKSLQPALTQKKMRMELDGIPQFF